MSRVSARSSPRWRRRLRRRRASPSWAPARAWGLAWIVYGLGERDDASVFTVDTNEELLATVATAGWPSYVEFVHDDGVNAVREFAPFDLVFADAAGGKLDGLDVTIDALTPGGVLIVDDMDLAAARRRRTVGAARGGAGADPRRSVAGRRRARLRERCDRGDEALAR